MYNFVQGFNVPPPKEFDGKKILDSYAVYDGNEFLRKVIYTEDYERYEFGRVENDNRSFTYIFRNKRVANDEERKRVEKKVEEEQKQREKTKKEIEIFKALAKSQMCGNSE